MSDVCAIVVTYHPNAEVPGNIAAVRRQVQRVVIIDNSSSPQSHALLAPLIADPGVELVSNQENVGIAAAFNQGVERAVANGFEWVATFDQDSRVPEGFIAGLSAGLDNYPDRERVAVVAPLYRDRNLHVVYSPSGPISTTDTADVVVSVTASSGNLVSARALRAVGGFREDFFIDCVDFEFCLRCRRRGWRVLEVRRVCLEHAQGHWKRRRWLWKTPSINDYNASRRYYQVRNRIVMYAEFASFDPRWMLRDAWGYVCDFVKLILFCENRGPKLRAVFAGVWHAFTGRLGPWEPPTQSH